MAEVPLSDRLAAMGASALPRRSAVAQWMRGKWDELEALGPGLWVSWSAIVEKMREDGVEGATPLQARQTYWRLKTSPQPWRSGGKPDVKPSVKRVPDPFSAPSAAPVAPKGKRRFSRVGE